MSKNGTHLASGTAVLVVGLVLALTTRDVSTPVVSLDKVGIALMVLGAVELLWTGATMLRPGAATRGRDR